MSRNFQPAFVGHPGVTDAPTVTPRGNPPHAIWMFSQDWEYRLIYADGTKTTWRPVSRGTSNPPAVSAEVQIRRMANGVVR